MVASYDQMCMYDEMKEKGFQIVTSRQIEDIVQHNWGTILVYN